MLSTFIWYRLVESNHYSHFRRMLSYPLNESGMVRETGLEPVCLSTGDFKSPEYTISPLSQLFFKERY
jgi:hypothetical protein